MEQFKQPLNKAAWTALETFLAVIIGAGVLDASVSTLEAGFVSAISAAITVVLVWIRENKTNNL